MDSSSVALLCPAWLHLLFLFPGLLSTLCTLIAPLPYPHKDSRPLGRGCQVAHKPLANEVSQPAGEVGRPGRTVRIIVEANRVQSPESNALTKVGEAEWFGRLAA